jgi:hypothetical protein
MIVHFYAKGAKTPMKRDFKPISLEYQDDMGRRRIKVIPKEITTHDITPKTEEVIERIAKFHPVKEAWEVRISKK